MAFSKETIEEAWNRSDERCECRRKTHNHPYVRCPNTLVWGRRGQDRRDGWEAHHIVVGGGDTLSNCEILCTPCHEKTRTYGK